MFQYKFQGMLNSNPFPNTLTLAERPRQHLLDEEELHLIEKFNISENTPIFLNTLTHTLLLERIVQKSQLLFIDLRLILIKYISSNIRLPSTLLEKNILLLHDPWPESRRLITNNIPHLCLDDSFLRYRTEKGENAIRVKYVCNNTNQLSAFNNFVNYLTILGISPCNL